MRGREDHLHLEVEDDTENGPDDNFICLYEMTGKLGVDFPFGFGANDEQELSVFLWNPMSK